MDEAVRRQRADDYLAMAHATYDLAERCDDLEMLRDYVEVAGRWFRMAHEALRATDADAPKPFGPLAIEPPESSGPVLSRVAGGRARPAA